MHTTATLEQKMPEEVMSQLNDHYETMEAEYAPDICNTLGLMAVKGDLVRVVILTHAEPWLEHELPDANQGVSKELQKTRDRIAAIEPSRRLEVGSNVLRRKVPQFLLNTLGVEYDHQIFERVVERTTDGSYAVSDDKLMNLLQWHNHDMTVWRKRFMEKEWPILKQGYTYKLKEGVRDGWLPETVLKPERLEALEQVEVTVDDGMLMHEDGTEAFMITYDTASSTEVFLPQHTYLETAYHELSHVMVGVRPPKDNSNGRFSGGQLSRGMYRLFDKTHINAGKVIDEAVTEHIAQTMGEIINPNPNVIDPKLKRGLRGCYYAERVLLEVLCNYGVKPVDIRLFTRAYFEDSTKLRHPAIRKLKRELKKAFPGHDVLSELGAEMSKGEYSEAIGGISQFTLGLGLEMAKIKTDKTKTAPARKAR